MNGRGRVTLGSPLEIARLALQKGAGPGVELEVYVQAGKTASVKTYGREIESISTAEPRGMGVRVVNDHRVGYAFSADLSIPGIERVLAEAAANAEASDPDPYVCLPGAPAEGYPEIPGLWLPGVSEMSLADKAGLALEAEAAALAVDRIETVEESMYSDSEGRVAVASTKGVEIEAAHSFCYVFVMAHAGQEAERQSGLGYTVARGPAGLDARSAGREAAEKARSLLGARPCRTGSYTVVFDREVASALLSSVVAALDADAVQKGRSVFAGMLDVPVASPSVRLLDDGLTADGLATNPFDGEGVPQERTALIGDGLLRSYLHSTYTANKAGGAVRSTGNGSRSSYRMLPQVGATNLVLEPGNGSLAGLLERVGEGLYVETVAGLNSGVNPVSGEISVGVTGHLIEGGSVGTPVREVTIATDFLSLLRSVTDLAGDGRWVPLYGSVFAPSIAVADIAVSGT